MLFLAACVLPALLLAGLLGRAFRVAPER